MPLNLIFTTADNYTVNDDGTPGNNTSVIRDGTGTAIFTLAHPADELSFTVSVPGVNLTLNLTDTLSGADLRVGSLTSPAVSPDSITIGALRTSGLVTLASTGTIRELGSDVGADIIAGQAMFSALTGVGTQANAIETQTNAIEARTETGGINISNLGNVSIGNASGDLAGLEVMTSGNITLTNFGTIILNDTTGGQSVRGGSTSGNVTLIANGTTSDIIGNADNDAITAIAGNIVLTAGRDIAFGTIGSNFDNDVRARGSITITTGHDFLIDGFSDLASDDFGANTGGNIVINAGHNIHVRSAAGTDGSIFANGTAGADVILTTGTNGWLMVDPPSVPGLAQPIASNSGDVRVNADRVRIASASGIGAENGQVTIATATAGREIMLGRASDDPLALELSDAELDRIFAPKLVVGSNLVGQITVSFAISPANATDLVLLGGDDILVRAAITTVGSLELRAGNNLILPVPVTITAGGDVAIFVDTIGNDAGLGGFVDLGNATINAASITVRGAEEGDTLTGAQGVDQTIHGLGGDDTITSSGEGRYFGDGGNDMMFAGLSTGLVPEVLDGGAGIDTLDTRLFTGRYEINLATGVTNFGYESFVNFENVITGDGDDLIRGSAGDNTIISGGGEDELFGRAGNDTMRGGGLRDVLYGGEQNDALYGDGGNDVLVGSGGADTLYGGIGNDRLVGGLAKDLLFGGAGADQFVFRAAAEAGAGGGRDVIGDFETGIDKINLSGVQAGMVFIGTAAFTGVAGQIRFNAAQGIVTGDIDGDGLADFAIELTGVASLSAGDFIL